MAIPCTSRDESVTIPFTYRSSALIAEAVPASCGAGAILSLAGGAQRTVLLGRARGRLPSGAATELLERPVISKTYAVALFRLKLAAPARRRPRGQGKL
mmetsp:Transcript_12376/g.28924  ORF Transcript_12376/g.28924 Transcript_12376/m.28924 type:complete len:99 (-) Transcript_12376:9-305(-)